MVDPALAISGLTLVGASTAAFAGVKVALNGTREKIIELDTKLGEHVTRDFDFQLEIMERLVAIETKLDNAARIQLTKDTATNGT